MTKEGKELNRKIANSRLRNCFGRFLKVDVNDTKKCRGCGEILSIQKFSTTRKMNGTIIVRSMCRNCKNSASRNYTKTHPYSTKHPWDKTYKSIVNRTKYRNHDSWRTYFNMPVSITREDLRELWFENKAYLMKRPTIHRIDNAKGYVQGNLKYLEFYENMQLAHPENKYEHI